MSQPLLPLVAVDVGNSRVKCGLFNSLADEPPEPLPRPAETFEFDPRVDDVAVLERWLAPRPAAHMNWWIGSVQRAVASRLIDWLRDAGASRIALVTSSDLPLEVRLPRPDMVGIDRLVAAVAANRLRAADRPAVVVDLGTAITVDLVSADGEFLGGAIMPGIGLSARALHEFTDLLPLLDMPGLGQPPPALGTATLEALTAGIYWGAVGGIRELIARLGQVAGSPCDVLLSGGAAPAVAGLLGDSARYVPHLVLAGLALSAEHAQRASHRARPRSP